MNSWGFTAAVFVSKSEMHQLDGNPASITNLHGEFFSIFIFFYSSPS